MISDTNSSHHKNLTNRVDPQTIVNFFVQINQNESGSQSVTLSVNDVTDSDKGTYFCELDFSTQSSPLEITKTAQSDLDVYYPPTTVNLSTKMVDNGVIGRIQRFSSQFLKMHIILSKT